MRLRRGVVQDGGTDVTAEMTMESTSLVDDVIETEGDRKLAEITERLARAFASGWMIDWDELSETVVAKRLDEARGILDSIGVSTLVRSLELYVPCEPCSNTDHEHCTGFCSSVCCALDAAEKGIEELSAQAALCIEELERRLAGDPCVLEEHQVLERSHRSLFVAMEELAKGGDRFASVDAMARFARRAISMQSHPAGKG